jgi:hypothetical protein
MIYSLESPRSGNPPECLVSSPPLGRAHLTARAPSPVARRPYAGSETPPISELRRRLARELYEEIKNCPGGLNRCRAILA